MANRMKNLLAIVTLVYAALNGRHAVAAVDENQVLTWAISNAPPFHVLSGPLQNNGMCDALTDAVERALPELHYRTVIMPQTRIGVEFERSANLCFPCMIFNSNGHPRAHLTEPTHWYPPHGVITTHQMAEKLTAEFGNPIRLSELLAKNEYLLGYPDGRKFGELQPILESFAGSDSYRVLRTGDNASLAILDMIRVNRIQYTIDYPILIEYDRMMSGSEMAFIPIEEVSGTQILGAIGCTKNEWGSEMVNTLNAALSKVHQDTAFLSTLATYYSEIPEYFESYQTLVREFEQGTTPAPSQSNNPPARPFP